MKPTSLLAKDATFYVKEGLSGEDTYSFQCFNFKTHYLRHAGGRFRMAKQQESALYKLDASWKVVGAAEIEAPAEKPAFVEPELVGKHIRLESLNFPNHFVRHRNSQCWKDAHSEGQLYDDDSHWVVRAGLAGEGVSFESSNYSSFMKNKA